MEMVPPKIIEDGEIPQNKTSPHTKKNAALGAALGIMLVVAVTVIQNILDDSIKTEDDVAKYLDVPVLAVLPDKDEDKKINKRRK